MKKTTKIVALSLLTVAMCVSLIVGSTFALFTSESSTNIVVSSGKLDIAASISNVSTYSYDETDGTYAEQAMPDGQFIYGTAELDDGRSLRLSNMVPGDRVTLQIDMSNDSTVTAKYRTVVSCSDDTGLLYGLKITVGDKTFSGPVAFSEWQLLSAAQAIAPIEVEIALPYDATNEFMDKSCTLDFKVQAIQGNAETSNIYVEGDCYYVADDIGLAQLRDMVNAGQNDIDIELVQDVDLSAVSGDKWEAIGTSGNRFRGIFNGNGHAITGLTTNCLFNYIDSGATVENFSLDVHIVDAPLGVATGLAYIAYGSAGKLTTFRDITLTGEISGSNAYAAYFYNVTSFSSGDGSTEKATEVLIENCVNDVDVTSINTNRAVGFVGTNYSTSILFRNCVNTGDVSVTTTAGTNGVHSGAFVGYSMATSGIQNYRVTFEQCVNKGNVSSNSSGDGRINVGGFISTTQGGSATFIDCRNEGNVSAINNLDSAGNAIVGGLLGCDNRGGIVITNCVNTGTITGTVVKEINTSCNPQVGGLVGGSSGGGTVTITDCTSIGTLLLTSYNGKSCIGLLCGTSGGVGVTIMGTIRVLPDDISRDVALVATQSKIDAASDYTVSPYVG